jgi:membrane protein YqaA with SNARE-associated domain
MTQFEIYLLLFTDVLTANFAFNTSSEIVLDTMKLFGNYHKPLMLLVALIAYAFSIGINYILGVVCYKILTPLGEEQNQLNAKINSIKNFKLLPIIIAISFLPFFGKFIVLLTGFCRIKFKMVLLISVITKLVYYSFLIFFA